MIGAMDAKRDPDANPIDYEIIEEKAATLGRVTARLEATLAALEAAEDPALRASLREEAAEWLWYVVVQREAIGVTHHDALFEAYRIPPAIRRIMGPRRKPPSG